MTTSIFFPFLFCIPLLSSTPGFASVNPSLKLFSPRLFSSLKECLSTAVTPMSLMSPAFAGGFFSNCAAGEAPAVTHWAPKSLDSDWNNESKSDLFLGWKAMTNLDSVLKNRDITLLTKVSIVKAMVFPVVMYGCESWTLKKAELQGIDAFELWCWRRLLRVSWTARRSNLSILKNINPKYPM